MKSNYDITGMHCAGCVRKVEEAIQSLDSVKAVKVDLENETATIESEHEIDLSELKRVVQRAGDYQLREQGDTSPDAAPSPSTVETNTSEPPESLYPLFLIVGYILGAVLLIAFATGDWSLGPMMRHFMAGFFLVFSFFKLLDLSGFVTAYRGYDLLAARSASWAYAYPFVELTLGIAYLIDFIPVLTNIVTFLIMTIGAIGVLKALLDKRRIQCACLGTALNLPMTKVTLIEDLTMAAMAAGMLIMIWM
jgi:copper chaperone CopZ